MSIYEIPTSADQQTFIINLNGLDYNLVLYWNNINQTWMLNIGDTKNNKILSGIPIVANVDLLKPYSYLNFGGQLIAQTDRSPDSPPTFSNLGTNGHIYFVTA